MRKLNFSENIGVVQLTVTFDDGNAHKFTVTPFQAIVISSFSKEQGDPQITRQVADLAAELQLDTDTVLKSLIFWNHCGVLAQISEDTFQSVPRKLKPLAAQHMLSESSHVR